MKTRIVSTATVATLVISALSMHEKALATLVESQPSLIKPQGPDGAQTDSVMRLLSKKEYDEALDAAQKTIQSSPDDPRGYTMQGAAYFGKQDLKHARESFEKALKLRKDYEPALLGLAEIDLRENKYSVARDRYQAVLAKDPGSVPAMLGMARVESANKNESESVAWVERAKLSRPDALVPRLLLAGRYIDKREYDKALAELTEARRFHPNEPRVLDMRGQVQAAQGKYDDAVSTFKKLVELNPQSGLAYRRLAAAQLLANDISGAKATLNQALKIAPNDVETLSVLSTIETRSGQYAPATELAKKVQTLSPGSGTGFVLEGDALLAQKRYSQAASAYEKALALSPAAAIVVRVHSAYVSAGNTNEAEAKVRNWIKAHPEDVSARLYFGTELAKARKTRQAIELYEAVLQRDPKNVAALNNLANSYHQEGDQRARRVAEQAYQLSPDVPTVADTLGWILVQTGQTFQGLELLQKASAQAPQNAEIRYHLAVALAKSGDKAKARKELEQLLATSDLFPQREAARTLLKEL